ncbi:hypothetical protein V8C42DRAFT_187255 [Trichoderma barbatum]
MGSIFISPSLLFGKSYKSDFVLWALYARECFYLSGLGFASWSIWTWIDMSLCCQRSRYPSPRHLGSAKKEKKEKMSPRGPTQRPKIVTVYGSWMVIKRVIWQKSIPMLPCPGGVIPAFMSLCLFLSLVFLVLRASITTSTVIYPGSVYVFRFPHPLYFVFFCYYIHWIRRLARFSLGQTYCTSCPVPKTNE